MSRWTTPRECAWASAVAEVGRDLGDVAVVEPALGLEAGQRVAWDQLRDEHRMAGVLSELVEGHDRRVVESGGRLGLAQDPVRVRIGELLQRHLALEPLVVGSIDGSHPAGADPLDHAETVHHQVLHHNQNRSAARLALLPVIWPWQGSYSARRKANPEQLWLSSTRTNSNRPDQARGPAVRGPNASVS